MITAAIDGFEAQKLRIDGHIAELRGMLDGRNSGMSTRTEPKRSGRKISAAGRRRIAEAQRKRWAELKKSAVAPVNATAEKPKRKLSAAGRKNIIAATKKRWAAVRAARKLAAKTAS